jgi:N-methylhydantoinase B
MTATLDPVTLEVIRNALPAVANEMAVDLQRTSYNMMIYEVRDFCTALVNNAGELICQNVGGVSHFVADLGVIIIDAMTRYGKDGFLPGDVIITNHQAVAGQHLNNIVIYAPYFHDGELLMFAMVRAHWIDVGGMSTGFGAGPTVADPWVEGLQLNQLKIYEAGKLNETLYRVLEDNIRFPESSLGDMKSQMAACRLAARRMDELFGKYGRDTILEAIARIFDETEAKCRNVVSQLADGVYEAAAALDEDGVTRGEPVPIHAKVTIDQGAMTIDLSGCSQERRAAINSRTLAGARVAYKALTGPLDPVNEGSFRALEVIIPEGNIMMARFPAPMSTWSMIVPMVVDTIVAALAPATLCSAARWCSSARIRRPTGASWCRASKAAAGAGGRSKTASPARCRCARATCATVQSKASSSNARSWSRAARCARIPAARGNIAAASASICACAT